MLGHLSGNLLTPPMQHSPGHRHTLRSLSYVFVAVSEHFEPPPGFPPFLPSFNHSAYYHSSLGSTKSLGMMCGIANGSPGVGGPLLCTMVNSLGMKPASSRKLASASSLRASAKRSLILAIDARTPATPSSLVHCQKVTVWLAQDIWLPCWSWLASVSWLPDTPRLASALRVPRDP